MRNLWPAAWSQINAFHPSFVDQQAAMVTSTPFECEPSSETHGTDWRLEFWVSAEESFVVHSVLSSCTLVGMLVDLGRNALALEL